MKSPFPGMDPYLEQHWGDVHASLIIYSRDQLQEHLPDDLRARVQERVILESAEGEERSIYPDVRVVEHGRRKAKANPRNGGLAVAEPLVLHVDDEPVKQGFIEIIDVGTGNRVVTVIEFLSPSNKLPGEGYELYRKKQRECKDGGVSLVEIDLLRAGRRVFVVAPERIPRSHRTSYQVCVRRGWKADQVELYAISLRKQLPVIGIPLRPSDQDVPLDLQALIEKCYRNGRYSDLAYAAALDPLLEAADAKWAAALLRSRKRR